MFFSFFLFFLNVLAFPAEYSNEREGKMMRSLPGGERFSGDVGRVRRQGRWEE